MLRLWWYRVMMRDYQNVFCFVSFNQNVRWEDMVVWGQIKLTWEIMRISPYYINQTIFLTYNYDVTISHIQTFEVPLTSPRIYVDVKKLWYLISSINKSRKLEVLPPTFGCLASLVPAPPALCLAAAATNLLESLVPRATRWSYTLNHVKALKHGNMSIILPSHKQPEWFILPNLKVIGSHETLKSFRPFRKQNLQELFLFKNQWLVDWELMWQHKISSFTLSLGTQYLWLQIDGREFSVEFPQMFSWKVGKMAEYTKNLAQNAKIQVTWWNIMSTKDSSSKLLPLLLLEVKKCYNTIIYKVFNV